MKRIIVCLSFLFSLFIFALPVQAQSNSSQNFRPQAPGLSSQAPVPVPQRFWVDNYSNYEIYHVFVQKDHRGSDHDLMGPNGVIPPRDQAEVLRPNTSTCRSNVSVVAYDPSDNTTSTKWFRDVYICSRATVLTVRNDDFTHWN